jgi:hypothetical protein
MRATTVLLLAAVLATAALGGCGTVATLDIPPPAPQPSTTVGAQGSLPGDLSAVSEPVVAGSTTTTTPAIGPGNATISGTVQGPSGPLGGATVEADRFVGEEMATAETTTSATGGFSFANVLGGRYRLRAWQSPSFSMTTPDIVYVPATGLTTVNLQLSAYNTPSVQMAFSPPQPIEGQLADLTLEVTQPVVEANGVVDNPPAPGVSVALTGGPEWDVYNGNPLTTGPDGTVTFEVSCQAPGTDPLSAQVGSLAPQPLPVPFCTPPAPPTTTTTTTTTLPPFSFPTFPPPPSSVAG